MNADDGWNRVASGRIYSGSPVTGSEDPSSPQSTAAFAPIGVAAAASRRSLRSGRNHSVRASQQLGALDSGRWGGTDAGGSDLERSLLPSDAPPKGPTIRERIEAIYGVHSPEKLDDVDDMIDRYGAAPSPPLRHLTHALAGTGKKLCLMPSSRSTEKTARGRRTTSVRRCRLTSPTICHRCTSMCCCPAHFLWPLSCATRSTTVIHPPNRSTTSPLMPPYRDVSSSGRVQSIRM